MLNGIIGLLPNEGIDRKVLITGELKMALFNPFGSGKRIKAHWKKMQPFSQQLELEERINLFAQDINMYRSSTGNFQ